MVALVWPLSKSCAKALSKSKSSDASTSIEEVSDVLGPDLTQEPINVRVKKKNKNKGKGFAICFNISSLFFCIGTLIWIQASASYPKHDVQLRREHESFKFGMTVVYGYYIGIITVSLLDLVAIYLQSPLLSTLVYFMRYVGLSSVVILIACFVALKHIDAVYNYGLQLNKHLYWKNKGVRQFVDWVQTTHSCCLYPNGTFEGRKVESCFILNKDEFHAVYNHMKALINRPDMKRSLISHDKSDEKMMDFFISFVIRMRGQNFIVSSDCAEPVARAFKFVMRAIEGSCIFINCIVFALFSFGFRFCI